MRHYNTAHSYESTFFVLLHYESKVLLMCYSAVVILCTTSVTHKTCFVASQIVCLLYNSENKLIISTMIFTECFK
jgi:hypothetical protein